MNSTDLIGPWARRFLLEHIVQERNLSRNTQLSYRDALALFLPFASKILKKPIDRLTVTDLSAAILRRFLDHTEHERNCSVSTRNQRLGALRALARFISMHSPETIDWSSEIRSIPFKKTTRPLIDYLDREEMAALLDAPDRRTKQGTREHTILLFLYNTGARADEAARLVVADLELTTSPSARIAGKGNKTRLCPLWKSTADALAKTVAGRRPDERVFLNCRRQPMTRFGLYALVTRCARKAASRMSSIETKNVNVHCIRHSTAVHLLQAGVDINTIRAWLGHTSLDTTHIYAEIDVEMKAKALDNCEIPGEGRRKIWHKKPTLMAFLKAL